MAALPPKPAAGTHAEATKHADTTPHTTHKSFKSDRRDKPKHSGKTGAVGGPKKGGGGGKGTWGRPGDESKLAALSPNDPNFDDEAEEGRSTGGWDWEPSDSSTIKFASSLQDQAKFKSTVRAACKEFLQSNDFNEFSRILKGLSMTVFHQDLPTILIKYSLDLTPAERGRVSGLLGQLHREGLVTHVQMGAGVRKLFNSLSDLQVDCPNARTLLREHVQFAVAGGFLDAALAAQLEAEQVALADEAKVNEAKARIKAIVTEFFRSEDLPDAVKSLTELAAPHLAFEVVKQLVLASLDAGNRQREGASVFLADQAGAFLPAAHIEKAFTILLERVEDLQLDHPGILKLLSVFVARAVVDEALAPAFLVRVDLNSADLGSRVLQQAQTLLAQENASERLTDVWDELEEEVQRKRAANLSVSGGAASSSAASGSAPAGAAAAK